MELLTATRLRDARSCQRFHFIHYELGYKPAHQAAAPRFGSLFHKGLEAWWRSSALPAEDRLAAALAAVAGAVDAFERVKAEEMLRGYHYRWIDEPLEVIAVEQQFEGPLRNPETGATSRTWRLGGKVDVLVRDLRDGQKRLVEHKTSSEDITLGSEYWQRLRMDGQISVYYEGSSLLGHEVTGCVYDVAGTPSVRPSSSIPLVDDDGVKIVHDATGARVRTKDGKKWRQTGDTELGYALQTRDETAEEYRTRLSESIAADPDRYFQRGVVVRLESEMDEAMGDVWQQGQVIHENKRANRHPRNPDACKRYGRTCEFWAVCTSEASLDDTTRFVKLESVHPELSLEAP